LIARIAHGLQAMPGGESPEESLRAMACDLEKLVREEKLGATDSGTVKTGCESDSALKHDSGG